MRRGACFAAITAVLVTLATVGAAPAQPSLTLEQARTVARQALRTGQPQLALEIARGLLQANKRDADALLIVAAAQGQLGNPINGRRAATRAYRYSNIPRQKLDAAKVAATLAARKDRYTLTQIWLRRASLHTNSPEAEQKLARDYQRARNLNPWRFNVSTSLRPSSNVNNGSENETQTVDGVSRVNPILLSVSAQALSGLTAEGEFDIGYRLARTNRSMTELATRVRVTRVALSSEAHDKADAARAELIADGVPLSLIPDDPKNSDFGSTYADLRVRHSFQIGDTRGDTASLNAGIATLWYAGERESNLANVSARRTWALKGKTRFTLAASAQHRDVAANSANDTNSFGLLGAYSQQLQSGAFLSVVLSVAETQSDSRALENTAWTMRSSYRFAEKWGPARATASFSLTDTAYPYFAFLDGFVVPEGRDDVTVSASLNLFFEDYDYFGFAPEMTLRARKRESNVNRYDTSELSLSLGFRSKF